MSNTIQTPLSVGCGFFLIGCLTWFFCCRRQTFLRLFVPADELRAACRSIPRGDEFRRGMRSMAMLQMGLGVVIVIFVWIAGLV